MVPEMLRNAYVMCKINKKGYVKNRDKEKENSKLQG